MSQRAMVFLVQLSEAVPPGFHNDEGAGQVGFSISLKDPFQLLVGGLQGGWSNAQVDDAFA